MHYIICRVCGCLIGCCIVRRCIFSKRGKLVKKECDKNCKMNNLMKVKDICEGTMTRVRGCSVDGPCNNCIVLLEEELKTKRYTVNSQFVNSN